MDERWREDVWKRRRRRMYLGALFAAVAVIGGVIGAAGIAALGDGGTTEQASASATRAKPDKRELARKRRQRVTLSAVGDIVMGTPEGGLPPDGGASLFQAVDGNLKGALVLGNLEGPLTDGGTSKCPSAEVAADDADPERTDEGTATGGAPPPPTCFAFRTPTSYASHLALAGFTIMNLANNHALDYGQSGLDSTIAALRAHDIMHTGPKGKISRFRTTGLRIAVVGFAPYEFANSLTDLDAVREITKEAGRQADIVIATMHAGAEGTDAARVPRESETFLGEQRGDPRTFARAAVIAGADLVIGHGPHVLRGMEVFRNRLIAYSLGNFVGYRSLQTSGALGIGASLTVTVDGTGRLLAGRLFPVKLNAQGVPKPGGDAIGRVRTLSQRDFGKKRAVTITSSGRITAP